MEIYNDDSYVEHLEEGEIHYEYECGYLYIQSVITLLYKRPNILKMIDLEC